MRTLVTGGAGFIGSHLVDVLIAHGHEVWVVDDLSTGRLSNLAEARATGALHFHRFDIRSDGFRDVLERARPDVVYHLAGQGAGPASVLDPVRDAELNVVGLLKTLDASVAAGAGKFVFASSAEVYGEQKKLPVTERVHPRPATPLGIAKRSGEDYVRFYGARHGLDFTSLVVANAYGPRDTSSVVAAFVSDMSAGRSPTIFGTGEATRDLIFVEDVVHAFVLAASKGGGETVNVGTGAETSIRELYDAVASATGFDGPPQSGPARPGELSRVALDPGKGAGALGWTPWTKVPDGIRLTLAP